MDILEEIDEALKDKKEKWKYTPMRETNETDAIIDELLREFSSDSPRRTPERKYSRPAEQKKPEPAPQPQYQNPQPVQQPVQTPLQNDYNIRSEQEEREEYNRFANNNPKPAPADATQIYSINDLPTDNSANHSSDYNNYSGYSDNGDNSNDNYDDYDDEYYDDEFDESHKMNADEFTDFLNSEDDRNRDYVPQTKKSPWKTAFKIIYTAVIAAFTIIGIFSSVIFCMEKFEMMPSDKTAADDSLKNEIQQVIYPLVETQVSDFESYKDISDEQLVNIAVWEIIINGDISIFKESDNDDYLIPQSQIEYVADKLFGDESTINNVSSGINDVSVLYDKDKEGYIVPKNYYIYTIYPVVTDVSQSDDTYTVSVDCFYDSPAWRDNKKTMAGKKMVFTLKKTSDYYNIISAKTVS